MTKISVSSRICGTKHTVKGRVEGNKIIIEIETPCEKFREFTYLEIPIQELVDIEKNLITEMERQVNCSFKCMKECALDCTRQCLIPSAVFNVYSREKELEEAKLIKTSFLETTTFTTSEIE